MVLLGLVFAVLTCMVLLSAALCFGPVCPEDVNFLSHRPIIFKKEKWERNLTRREIEIRSCIWRTLFFLDPFTFQSERDSTSYIAKKMEPRQNEKKRK